MKLLLYINLFVCVLLLAVAASVMAENELDDLFLIANSQVVDENALCAIFKSKNVKIAIQSMIGNDRFNKFMRIISVGPVHISKNSNFVLFSQCEPHHCMDFHADFYINPKNKLLSICWTDHKNIESLDETWFSPKGPPINLLNGPTYCTDNPIDVYNKLSNLK